MEGSSDTHLYLVKTIILVCISASIPVINLLDYIHLYASTNWSLEVWITEVPLVHSISSTVTILTGGGNALVLANDSTEVSSSLRTEYLQKHNDTVLPRVNNE